MFLFVKLQIKSIEKRKVELVVLSDVHLGTFGSHAQKQHHLSSIA
jgi:hypothetical protein